LIKVQSCRTISEFLVFFNYFIISFETFYYHILTRVLKNILFLIASFNWIHVTVVLPNLIHVSCVWLVPYWIEFLYFTLLHVLHCCRCTFIHIYCCTLIYYFKCCPVTRWSCSATVDNCGASLLLCFRPLYSIQIIKGRDCSSKLKRFHTCGPFVFLFFISSSCIVIFSNILFFFSHAFLLN